MRPVTAAAQSKLNQKRGLDPIIIVDVDWGSNSGGIRYADRAVSGIQGRIVSIGRIDNSSDLESSTSSQEVSIVLDDTDGHIKRILQTQDVHQCNVRVYQWFDGLDLSDKIHLFTGKLSTPIVWSESDRTFTFSAVSQLDDWEIGFSAELANLNYIPSELQGQSFPMVFGTVYDLPTVELSQAKIIEGKTLCGVGILAGEQYHMDVPLSGDTCGLGVSLAMMAAQVSFCNIASSAWSGYDSKRSSQLFDQANEIRKAMSEAAGGHARSVACARSRRIAKFEEMKAKGGEGCNPLRIEGGEDFPQNRPIRLKIKDATFTGKMVGQNFHITHRSNPELDKRVEENFADAVAATCEGASSAGGSQRYDFSMQVPPGRGNVFTTLANDLVVVKGFIICNEPSRLTPTRKQVAEHWWAEPGTRVTLDQTDPVYYVASITPLTIHGAKAEKEVGDVNGTLTVVPAKYWNAQTRSFGNITTYGLYFPKRLSSLGDDPGWDDDVFVTATGTIGPNVSDILKYLILNWTTLEIDAASFAYVRTKVTAFPAGFAIRDQRDALSTIKEIAFQARCALWIRDNTVFLKYLPEEPVSDMTITLSDIVAKSITVETTATEDLATKLNVKWTRSYAEDENVTVLRSYNIDRYGVKEEDLDMYIYNNAKIVHHNATFWLIRKSNTWKRVVFTGFHHLLPLEPFDTITLDLGDDNLVANGTVKAIVERTTYNPDDHTVEVECLTPVRFGEMAPYDFFWPAGLSSSLPYPPPKDVASRKAYINHLATILSQYEGAERQGVSVRLLSFEEASDHLATLFPDLDTAELRAAYEEIRQEAIESGYFVGGPNSLQGPSATYGSRYPSDTGFSAGTDVTFETWLAIDEAVRRILDLELNYVDRPSPAILSGTDPAGSLIIDIRKTKIIDTNNPNEESTLSTFIKKISNEELILDTEAEWEDGESRQAEFDFKYDSEGQKFGAGTAFLKDEG